MTLPGGLVDDPKVQQELENIRKRFPIHLQDVGADVLSGSGIPGTLLDAKGDIIVATADNTPARQGIGSNGDVLTADSTTTNGLKWAPAAGGAPSGPAGGALDGTYPNPGIAASVAGAGLAEAADVLSVVVDGSTIEINVDTLRVKADGITATQIAADAVGASEIATDSVGTLEIAPLAVTDAEVAAANKDGIAATPSMRTLGTGAQQAMAGNATPGGPPTGTAGGVLDGSYPSPGIAAGVAGGGLVESPADVLAVGAGTGVTVNANDVAVNYGATGTTACVGNDARLSDARTPTGAAGGDLTGTYANPTVKSSFAALRNDSEYQQMVLALGPSLYWRLGSSGGADLSGNARDGTAAGGVTIGGFAGLLTADQDAATDFDGVDDRITSTYAPFTNGTQRTWCGWAYRDTLAAIHYLVGSSTGVAGDQFLIRGSTTGQMSFCPNGTGIPVSAAQACPLGRVFFWTVTFDETANVVNIFVDGALVGLNTAYTEQYAAAPGNLQIGAWGAGTEPFDGRQDEFAVFERILTLNEIRSLYNAGSAAIAADINVVDPMFTIAAGDTYTVGTGRQSHWNHTPTTLNGNLEVQGHFVESTFNTVFTPNTIYSGTEFTVPINRQGFFADPILVDGPNGQLVVEGNLLDVGASASF